MHSEIGDPVALPCGVSEQIREAHLLVHVGKNLSQINLWNPARDVGMTNVSVIDRFSIKGRDNQMPFVVEPDPGVSVRSQHII